MFLRKRLTPRKKNRGGHPRLPRTLSAAGSNPPPGGGGGQPQPTGRPAVAQARGGMFQPLARTVVESWLVGSEVVRPNTGFPVIPFTAADPFAEGLAHAAARASAGRRQTCGRA